MTRPCVPMARDKAWLCPILKSWALNLQARCPEPPGRRCDGVGGTGVSHCGRLSLLTCRMGTASWGSKARSHQGSESPAPRRGSPPAAQPALPRPLGLSPTCARPMPFYLSFPSVLWGAIAHPALRCCLSHPAMSPGDSKERCPRLQGACWVALCPGHSLRCPGHPPQIPKRVPL